MKQALLSGQIIEDYPTDRPFSGYLVLGYTRRRRPLHMVVAADPEETILWVITVYEPKPKEWEQGFKKRRQNE